MVYRSAFERRIDLLKGLPTNGDYSIGITALALKTRMINPEANRQLDRLEAKGLVMQRYTKQGENRISLTRKGFELLMQLYDLADELEPATVLLTAK